MKIEYARFVKLSAILICCSVTMADKVNAEKQIQIMEEGIDVVFVDKSLTDLYQNEIIEDYKKVLKSLNPNGLRPMKSRAFEVAGEELLADRRLRYSTKYLKRPDGFEDQFGIVSISKNGRKRLILPKMLTDGYKQSINLKLKNENAYKKLPEFISLMNNLNEAGLPPVSDLIYLHGEAQQYSDDLIAISANKFIDDYSGFIYASGSLLELKEINGDLVYQMYIFDKKNNNRLGEIPIIYHKTRWRIFVSVVK